MARFLLLFSLFLSSTACVMAQTSLLKEYRWNNRIVLLNAADDSSVQLQQQMDWIHTAADGYRERDLVVISMEVDGTRDVLRDKSLSIDPIALRKRYGVVEGAFSFLLIGKDGGIKLQSTEAVSSERLFAIIDAMPMRRQEMRSRNKQ